MSGESSPKMTLNAEMKSVARARILRATRVVLARQGLNCTVDDVASEAGVSRRTVFRYFPSHGQLLAAAFAEIIDEFQTVVPPPPEAAADVDSWFLEIATALHTFNAEEIGQAFWDLYADRPGLPAELADVLDTRLGTRLVMAESIAQQAWHAVGGRGAVPPWVVDSCLLHLSGFAFHGFQAGREHRSPAETAEVSAVALSAVLQRALEDQERARPRSSR